MIVFTTDLDNTILFSYKHDIGQEKRCVEVYQGREISFITEKTFQLLQEISRMCILVPATTRTVEQYIRIDLGLGVPDYALVCNGGVLLEQGRECEEWYRESCRLVSDCREDLLAAGAMLGSDRNRTFEVRNIRDLFVFTKSSSPLRTMERLASRLDMAKVAVFHNGAKVYVVPRKLNKGRAALRLKERLGAGLLAAAGDSEFDVPMLKEADFAAAPGYLRERAGLPGQIAFMDAEGVFSEFALEHIYQAVLRFSSF